ncbi:PAS domain S-box protein [Natronolimnobius sp. AArcel1]|uniref:PAS domain S-box protein n=1 Tax=Natronolimnobius sp. AArcel1 TaxID=1679093 RepID=UPI0013EBCB70|nr:PAS domain S-box protein [Natronolimnobius sp. AArcel1]NGM67862.1 PAS domain S-box protein [Natronolimnobius sp. AArcel1]
MPDFESLLDRSSELFTVVETGGTILYQNAAVNRHCGYTQDDLIETSLLESIHPTDRPALEALLERPEQATLEEPIDYRIRHADGSWVWFETQTPPHLDPDTGGYVLVSRPVDERRALERRRERYMLILDSLNDAVYAIDADDTIVYVNDAYASLKQIDRDELIGTNIYKWGKPAALETIDSEREALETGEQDVGIAEFEFSTTDGPTVPVELRFSFVEASQTELAQVGVVRDITARKARERALERKNERLEAFASIVSHDLRNPLNVASGHLELGQEQAEHGHDHFEEIAAAHSRIDTLIETLLTLAREGESVTDPCPVELAAVVDRSWRGVETADARLELDTDRVVLADDSRLQQLLENLVRNAIEHAGPDITVTVEDCPNGFAVTDDGPGIPESEREQVFDFGYSSDADGTGFGLNIVREIATAHDWSITATESTQGGARFEITDVVFDT